MTYRPMLFNTPMVCAIEDGTKTQTRRLVQLPKNKDWELLDVHPNPDLPGRFWQAEINGTLTDAKKRFTLGIKAPCVAGDVLWVRETWTEDGRNFYYRADFESDWLDPCETLSGGYPIYCSYHPGCEGCMREKQRIHWRPSIHMPKKAARTFLRVTDVFMQHLSSIKEIHAQWEGVDPEPPFSFQPYTRGFIKLWDSLIQKSKLKQYGYGADPWVWVIMFERIQKPEGWNNEKP